MRTDDADGADGATAVETPSRFAGMTIVEPATATEMRGALVKGWHAMYYESPDGSSPLAFD